MNTKNLIAYNAWANRLVCTQVLSLPDEVVRKSFGGSFGSIRSTIIHLMESDWIWLNRWKGIPLADIPTWDLENSEAITMEWLKIQDAMLQIANDLEKTPEVEIKFVTRKGVPFKLPFNEIAVHVMNHGSYHRGQIANMVRAAGFQPASTDYFIFCTQ